MKKKITKRRVVFTFEPQIIKFMDDNFENKSKYVEYLIFKYMKENDLLKKDLIIL